MNARFFEDFSVGDCFSTEARVISTEDVKAFAALTGDGNPIHLTPPAGKDSAFDRPIVHGALVSSVALGLISALGLSRGTLVAMLEHRLVYKQPVFHGESVQVALKVLEARKTRHAGRGIVRYSVEIKNGDGTTVVEGELTNMMRRRPAS